MQLINILDNLALSNNLLNLAFICSKRYNSWFGLSFTVKSCLFLMCATDIHIFYLKFYVYAYLYD